LRHVSSTKSGRQYNPIGEQSRNKTEKAKGTQTKAPLTTDASFFSEKCVHLNRIELLYSFSKTKQMAGKKRRQDIMKFVRDIAEKK